MFANLKKYFSRKTDTTSYITISPPNQSGMNENYLFDFKNYQSGYNNNNSFFVTGSSLSVDSQKNEKPRKIAIKPIQVLDQLEKVPTPWTLTNLDDKIGILEYKRELIRQEYSKREVEALIERLENRKKYVKFKKYFDQFENTTDEKIAKLLEKYDLEMHTSDLFVPEFPDDAIAVMKSYTEQMKKICKKKPVFYVISEPSDFKKKYEKRDPILLVQSPFGFYWQVLGAWDEEMLLLSEL
jgi:hypothetical protein